MAEFGIQATQLNGPQRAGAVAQEGIETPVSGPVIPSSIAQLTGDTVVGFARDQAKSANNAIFSNYQKEMAGVSQALESGQMSATQAAARTRAIGTKYAANYSNDPAIIQGLGEIKKSITGITSLSAAEDAEDSSRKIRDQEISRAISQGFKIDPDMSPQNLEPILAASREMARADDDIQRNSRMTAEQRAAAAEGRATADYNYKITERTIEQNSREIINRVAFTNVDAMMAGGRDLSDRVAAGKLTLKEAQAEAQAMNNRIAMQLQAAAGQNPALAAPWIKIYEDIAKANTDYLDPSKDRKTVEDQWAVAKTQAYLASVQRDPSLMGFVVASQLLPNTPLVDLAAGPQIAGLLASYGAIAPGTGKVTPVLGSAEPGVESGTYQTLSSALGNIQVGKVGDAKVATEQAKNSLNHILGQVGKSVNDQDIKDTDLKEVSNFMAQPQFAYAVSNNMLDGNARQAARDAWQVKYQQSVVKGVQANLNKTVSMDTTPDGMPGDGNVSQLDNPKLADLVNIEFTGSGIKFTGKVSPATQGRMNSSINLMNDLKKTTTAVNQLIRIGAHLEGSTDYKAYWEANQFRLLPDFYADPSRLKEGDVKNGYRFKGGNTRDSNNWERVPAKSGE